MTDRDLALMVVHELEAKAMDGAGYSLRREQAEAIRRLMEDAEYLREMTDRAIERGIPSDVLRPVKAR